MSPAGSCVEGNIRKCRVTGGMPLKNNFFPEVPWIVFIFCLPLGDMLCSTMCHSDVQLHLRPIAMTLANHRWKPLKPWAKVTNSSIRHLCQVLCHSKQRSRQAHVQGHTQGSVNSLECHSHWLAPTRPSEAITHSHFFKVKILWFSALALRHWPSLERILVPKE